MEAKIAADRPPSKRKRGDPSLKSKCPHCGQNAYHKPEKCWALEANKAHRNDWWYENVGKRLGIVKGE